MAFVRSPDGISIELLQKGRGPGAGRTLGPPCPTRASGDRPPMISLPIHDPAFRIVLDYCGVAVFAVSGALAAARRKYDIVTLRLLRVGDGDRRRHAAGPPDRRAGVLGWWTPATYAVCIACAGAVWAIGVKTWRMPALLWLDAVGLAAYAVVGASKAASYGCAPLVAVVMGGAVGQLRRHRAGRARGRAERAAAQGDLRHRRRGRGGPVRDPANRRPAGPVGPACWAPRRGSAFAPGPCIMAGPCRASPRRTRRGTDRAIRRRLRTLSACLQTAPLIGRTAPARAARRGLMPVGAMTFGGKGEATAFGRGGGARALGV